VSLTLLATLTGLGVIEHWFLVMPLDVGQLWSWGLRSHERQRPEIALIQPLGDVGRGVAEAAPVEAAAASSSLAWTRPVPCAGANP
jgi:hypothetical protein